MRSAIAAFAVNLFIVSPKPSQGPCEVAKKCRSVQIPKCSKVSKHEFKLEKMQ